LKKIIATLSLLILTAAPVQADSLKGGYGACITEDLFDQFTTAAVKKDERAFQYLQKNGCFITKAGIEISILDVGWTGTTKVRAYVGDATIVLWTNTENINRK